MDRASRHARAIHVTAVALVAACALPQASASQETSLVEMVSEEILADRLDAHAREITRYVRPSGSPGENAAIDYVVNQLRVGGVRVDVHEFKAYTSNPISASVEIPGTDFAPEAITMSFSGSTASLDAPAVDVGTLDDLPGLAPGTGEHLVVGRHDALPDVRGRVAVVTGQPRNIPTTVLAQLGAVAAIYVNPEERLNELIVTSTWGTPSLLSAHRLNELPVAQIRRSDGERLREMMAVGDVTIRITTDVDTGWRPLRLAVARIAPTNDPDAPFVLFGGHIDGWHYGATDEAASNAAMLELALAFHRHRDALRRGLVVAWWPGHSNARYGGSTWFADRFFDELHSGGLAYVNIDGIGQRGAKRFGASTSPALARVAIEQVESGTDQVIRPSRPGRNSDQAFNGAGLPLLQINHTRLAEDGGYWWWHTPEDTYDKIDASILELDTRLYAGALSSLLADAVYPVDLVAEARALMSALETRQDQAEGALDLTEPLERARELARTLESVEEQRAAAEASSDLDLAALSIIRPLHRIMFVPGSNHHPDPGIYSRPLPGLESAGVLAGSEAGEDQHGFAEAQLIRERNRILEAIREATHFAELLERATRRPGT